MKNSIDTIGNRALDLPVCGAVPEPTAPPCVPFELLHISKERQRERERERESKPFGRISADLFSRLNITNYVCYIKHVLTGVNNAILIARNKFFRRFVTCDLLLNGQGM